uniref:REJ domain-containing protein n=1 Tax=Lotharella globosa TaxID=91324 RepID=A0A6V3NWK8_9EUKA
MRPACLRHFSFYLLVLFLLTGERSMASPTLTPTGSPTLRVSALQSGTSQVYTLLRGLNKCNDIALDSSTQVLYTSWDYHQIVGFEFANASNSVFVAGGFNAKGSNDGLLTTARFDIPNEIALDRSSGYFMIFVASRNNDHIRRINVDSGMVTTLAGTRISSQAIDGIGTVAQFQGPQSIVLVNDYLYVGDKLNNLIRKIKVSTANVTTIAGTGVSGNIDGHAHVSALSQPMGLAYFQPNNVLYFVCKDQNVVRSLDLTTMNVTRVAGTGGSGSGGQQLLTVKFNGPTDLSLDPTANPPIIYVADHGNDMVISMDTVRNEVLQLIGSGGGYEDGPASTARLAGPRGVKVWETHGGGRALFIMDAGNDAIRKTVAISTLSPSTYPTTSPTSTLAPFQTPPIPSYTPTAAPSARQAILDRDSSVVSTMVKFNMTAGTSIVSIAHDTASYNVYVAWTHHIITVYNTIVNVTAHFGGSPNEQAHVDGPLATARFGVVTAMKVVEDGTNRFIYLTDTSTLASVSHSIRRISLAALSVETLSGYIGPSYADGTLATAQFNQPYDIIYLNASAILVADRDNHVIRLLNLTGGYVTTIAGNATGGHGFRDGLALSAKLNQPFSIAHYSHDDVIFIADHGNSAIRGFFWLGDIVATVAGNGSQIVTDGSFPFARFDRPLQVAVDTRASHPLLYVGGSSGKLRTIDHFTQQVGTLAGNTKGSNVRDGPAASAEFDTPIDFCIDTTTAGDTSLIVADEANGALRRISVIGALAPPSSSPTGSPTIPTMHPTSTQVTPAPVVALPTTSPTLTPTASPVTSAPTGTAPRPHSATFSASLTSILVTYDQDTNRPSTTCTLLLSNATVALLGAFPSCIWDGTNLRRLEILLGSGATVLSGYSLEFRGSVVYDPSSTVMTRDNVNVTLTAPAASASTLFVRISGASTLGPCDALALSASTLSGSGGRSVSYVWSYVGADPVTAFASGVVRELVSTTYSAELAGLRAANFSIGVHNVSVTAFNFVGWTASAYFSFEKVAEAVPLVQVWSPLVITSATSTSALTIRTRVSPPTCDASSSATGFTNKATWTQAFSSSPYLSATAAPYASSLTSSAVSIPTPESFYLNLDAGSLSAGHTYAFIMTAVTLDSKGVVGSINTTFVVQVQESSIIADLGASKRKVSVGGVPRNYTFDASSSYDPDSTSPLSFLFSVQFQNNGTVVATTSTSTSPYFILSSTRLVSNISYVVAVNVTGSVSAATGQARTAYAEQVVQTTAAAIPIVSANLVASTSAAATSLSKHNPAQRLVLSASVANHSVRIAGYLWMLTTSTTTSSQVDLADPQTRRSPRTSANLVVAANVLAAGETYLFEVAVTDVVGETGLAYVTVVTNAPPSLGTCGGTPEAGTALSTTFTLSCDGWSDEDTPIEYRFRCYQNVSGSLRLSTLSGYQDATSFETLLPQPPSGSDNLTVVASIRDALDSEATYPFALVVAKPSSLSLSDTKSSADAALTSGDTQTYVTLVSGMSSYLKEGGASNTTEAASVRASLLTSVASIATSDATEAAKLVETVTDFSDPSEITSESRQQAVSILSSVVTQLNSSTDIDDATFTETAQSTLGAVSNVVGAAGGTGGRTANLSASIESVLTSLAAATIKGAVEGEDATEVVSGDVAIVAQLHSGGSVEGINLNTSLGGSVSIGTQLGIDSSLGSVSTMMSYINDPLYPVTNVSLATGLISVELQQQGSSVTVRVDEGSGGTPFVIGIPLSLTQGQLDARTHTCQYWNTTTEEWATNGVTLVSIDTATLLCQSTHLTAFNGDSSIEINVNVPSSVEAEAFSYENPIMLACILIFTLYLISTALAVWKDVHVSKEEGDAASDSFWRQSNNARLKRVETGGRSCATFFRMCTWGLRRTHPWLAIWFRHPGDYITSTKRTTILLCLLFNTMAVVAALVGQDQKLPFVNGEVSEALVAMAFCFPVPFVMAWVHKREVPEAFRVRVVGNDTSSSVFGWCLLLFGLCCGELMLEDVAGGGDEEDDEGVFGDMDHQNDSVSDDHIEVELDSHDDLEAGEHARAAKALGYAGAGAAVGAVAGAAAVTALAPKARKERRKLLKEELHRLRQLEERAREHKTAVAAIKAREKKLVKEILQLPDEGDEDDDDDEAEPEPQGPVDGRRFNLGSGQTRSHALQPLKETKNKSVGTDLKQPQPQRRLPSDLPPASSRHKGGDVHIPPLFGRQGTAALEMLVTNEKEREKEEKAEVIDGHVHVPRGGSSSPVARADPSSLAATGVINTGRSSVASRGLGGRIISMASDIPGSTSPSTRASTHRSRLAKVSGRRAESLSIGGGGEGGAGVLGIGGRSRQGSVSVAASGSTSPRGFVVCSPKVKPDKSTCFFLSDDADRSTARLQGIPDAKKSADVSGRRSETRNYVPTEASLVRIRNDVKRRMHSFLNDRISLSQLDSVKDNTPTRCCCGCHVYKKNANLSTHLWTWHDVFGTVFELLVVFGCWFYLIVASWSMKDDYDNWTLVTVMSFATDVAFRIGQIVFLDFVSFVPLCFCCWYALRCLFPCIKGAQAQTDDRDLVTIPFKSGFLGFEYRNLTVVNVMKGSPAEKKGVRLGMRVDAVDGIQIADDKSFGKQLKYP